MWPTSIAVWNRSSPPQERQRSPSFGTRRSAYRGCSLARPRRREDASRCGWRRRRLPLPERLVGDDRARESHRAEGAALGAEGGPISSSVEGRKSAPRAAASFAGSSRSSPRISARTTVPSSFVTGIAFEVAARSTSRNPARSSHVVHSSLSFCPALWQSNAVNAQRTLQRSPPLCRWEQESMCH